MNEKCFEPGTIQAFLDGETAPALSFEITTHAATCDSCALLIGQAEEENAQVFAMLDREMNTLVPTQRLWNNITVAIAEEKRQHSIWDRIRSGLLATFASPSITVAASVLLVFGIFATVWTFRAPDAQQLGPYVASRPSDEQARPVGPVNTPSEDVQPYSASTTGDRGVRESKLPPNEVKDLVRTAEYRPKAGSIRPQPAVLRETEPAASEYLPGEESYIRTIASLKENVDARKDIAMSPSTRVAFERDLAVVDDSINKMKEVVQKDPKNQAAKQVLYSSYQNKIDLLNSVVEREELLASLQ